MAHLLSNSLLLYIPKTGSDWVRKTCHRSVEGGVRELGEWHCDLASANSLFRSRQASLPFTGAFVRHPFEWYRSAWIYWKETNRFPRRDDDPKVEHEDFTQFVLNCLDVEPTGYVTALYRRFLGEDLNTISFVGRQENLSFDLIRFLKLAGESFDETTLRSVPPTNVRGSRNNNGFPGYSFHLAEKVLKQEQEVIERFY